MIRGFSKFIFAAMNYNVFNLGAVITMVSLLFLLPFLLLPLGLYIFEWPRIINGLILAQVSVVLIIKIVLTFRFRSRIADILLHPVTMLYIIILSANSFYQAKYGKGIYWKNRIYDIRERDSINSRDSE